MDDDNKLHQAMKAKGHSPMLNDKGEIDVFVFDTMNHSGPKCFRCDWWCCQFCLKDETEIPQCTEVETSIVFVEEDGPGYTWTAKDKKYYLVLHGPTWILLDKSLRNLAFDDDIEELQKKIGFTIVFKTWE